MSDHGPEVVAFVENYVFDVLDAVRNSQEMQDRYMPLSPKIKRASTAELRGIARDCAKYLLANTEQLSELGNLENDGLIKEALLRATSNDG